MTDTTDNDRKCMFKDAVKNLECCAELVIKQLVDEERYTQLEELKSVMLEYCNLDNNWKHEKKILSKVDKSLREDINVNNIDEMYENLKKNETDTDPHTHEWYLNLEKKIRQWVSAEENDCDVVSTGMTQSLLDPFTKLQITDPVKNRCCGHSYEKDTILKLLKKHKQMRCPVVGCANRSYFNESHLEKNQEMMRQIILSGDQSHQNMSTLVHNSQQVLNRSCSIID